MSAEQVMTRAEAIQHVIGLELTVANDRYVAQTEHEAGMAETLAALRALGCSEDELGDHS